MNTLCIAISLPSFSVENLAEMKLFLPKTTEPKVSSEPKVIILASAGTVVTDFPNVKTPLLAARSSVVVVDMLGEFVRPQSIRRYCT